MLVVVLVPLVLAVSTGFVDNARPMLWKQWVRLKRLGGTEYTRTIRREKRLSAWGGDERDKEQFNHILQKAITLYLAQERPGALKGSKTAAILLTAVGKEKSSGRYSWNKSFGNTSEQLEQYAVTMAVPDNQWVWIDKNAGIQFMRLISDPGEEEEQGKDDGGSEGSKITIDFTFKCARSDGKQRIDRFLKDAFDWYVKQVEAQTDRWP